MSEDISEQSRLLLSMPEGAHRLSISPRALWQLLKNGRIPAVRVGRRVLVDPRDLTAFIDKAKGLTASANADAVTRAATPSVTSTPSITDAITPSPRRPRPLT